LHSSYHRARRPLILVVMHIKEYSLKLDVEQAEIFYSLEDVRGDGSMGFIYPDGSLHGLTYQDLLFLGTGAHKVSLDLSVPKNVGSEPIIDNEDDKLFDVFRFWLIVSRFHSYFSGQVFGNILLSFTPNNANRIVAMLNNEQIDDLRNYAKSFPASLTDREIDRKTDPLKYVVLCSGGYSPPVPEENLATIISMFQ